MSNPKKPLSRDQNLALELSILESEVPKRLLSLIQRLDRELATSQGRVVALEQAFAARLAAPRAPFSGLTENERDEIAADGESRAIHRAEDAFHVLARSLEDAAKKAKTTEAKDALELAAECARHAAGTF